MNGRMYDPVIGRFFSPDIMVPKPMNSQSYNRYSYCLNNPLKYVDPSGYSYRYWNQATRSYDGGGGYYDGRHSRHDHSDGRGRSGSGEETSSSTTYYFVYLGRGSENNEGDVWQDSDGVLFVFDVYKFESSNDYSSPIPSFDLLPTAGATGGGDNSNHAILPSIDGSLTTGRFIVGNFNGRFHSTKNLEKGNDNTTITVDVQSGLDISVTAIFHAGLQGTYYMDGSITYGNQYIEMGTTPNGEFMMNINVPTPWNRQKIGTTIYYDASKFWDPYKKIWQNMTFPKNMPSIIPLPLPIPGFSPIPLF